MSEQDEASARALGPWLLVLDTATSRVVVAAAALDGTLLGVTTWTAGRTHGEQLLPAIGRLHGEANLRRSRIRGVVIGTGPGAFTGLRVGLATAKALAHELDVPVVGVSTGEALIRSAGEILAVRGTPGDAGQIVLMLPAGPNDRHLVRTGVAPTLLPGGSEPELQRGDVLVDRAPADAVALGDEARDGLAAALVAIGARRLAAGDDDDLARLVPEYVTLPRGITAVGGEVAWSRDPR